MRFSHLSDCHIGSWKDPKLRQLNLDSFKKAIEISIKERVGFVIIAGDLFDTALPQIEMVREVADVLSQLKEEDIPVYLIPGSHDFSFAGKTMIDVLEHAGLVENVWKVTNDELEITLDKTGIKLAGFVGRKGGLERYEYGRVDFSKVEQEQGRKIFVFHTLLEEMKEGSFDKIDCPSIRVLPKGFNYYAGGHPHFIKTKQIEGYGLVAYPGPTFPNNVEELEELGNGGFFIVEMNETITPRHIPIKLKEVVKIKLNADNKSISDLEAELNIYKGDVVDKIVVVRIEGTVKEGKPVDLKVRKIFEYAFSVLVNVAKFVSKETEVVEVTSQRIEDIESELMKKNKSNKLENEEELIKKLLEILDVEKQDGERVADFEDRVRKQGAVVLGVKDE
ncbi:MAG: metallophosphoesterase [Candidatus Nanoarchaeia archaeon]